ncbi:MAG: hypothetical protein Q4G04_05060 [bacterium]|nr:hypothetical protein [bacterium]
MDAIIKFFDQLSSIKYGWYDQNNNLHEDLKGNIFYEQYQMQLPSQIIANNHAICFDICELEREFFIKQKIPFVTILALLENDNKYPCHTFLIFKLNNKYYWFEASWQDKKAIHQYNDVKSILLCIKENFHYFTKDKKYNQKNIAFYCYSKPKININCQDFFNHCLRPENKIRNYSTILK